MDIFRFLLSLLLIPTVIASALNGLVFLFVKYALANTWTVINGTDVNLTNATVHTMRGCVYYCIGGGLLASVILTVVCFVLMVLSFIFKTWTKAIVSGALCAFAIWLWIYYLNIPYPL